MILFKRIIINKLIVPKNKLKYFNGIEEYVFSNNTEVYEVILRWNEWKGLDAFTQRSYDGEDYEEYNFTLEDLIYVKNVLLSQETNTDEEKKFIKAVTIEEASPIKEEVIYIYQNDEL